MRTTACTEPSNELLAAQMFRHGMTALGTGVIRGGFEFVIRSQGGCLHPPEAPYELVELPKAPAKLLVQIEIDAEWLNAVVIFPLLARTFHGTATVRVVANKRGLSPPEVTFRQTLRSQRAWLEILSPER